MIQILTFRFGKTVSKVLCSKIRFEFLKIYHDVVIMIWFMVEKRLISGNRQTYPGFVDGFFVQTNETVDGALSDLQTGQMREKIVADKEAHKNPIVNRPLKVVRKGKVGHG